MLSMPDSIATQLGSQLGAEPRVYLDIWPMISAKGIIKTTSQWDGIGDVAASADVAVSASRKPGSLVLGNGSTTSIATVTPNNPQGGVTLTHEIKMVGLWNTTGNWLTGTQKSHLGYTVSYPINSAPHRWQFTAAATMVMDTILLSINLVGSGSDLTVRIIDGNGNQVGSAVKEAITASANYTLSGFQSSLRKGAVYLIEFMGGWPAAPGVQFATTVYTTALTIRPYVIAGLAHSIVVQSGYGFEIGGINGYASSGSAVRTMDVGSGAMGTGVVRIVDVVPVGVSLTVTAYYSDNPDSVLPVAAQTTPNQSGLSAFFLTLFGIDPNYTPPVDPVDPANGWISHGVVVDGDSVTAHRYWRFKIAMSSNAVFDETPELSDLVLTYAGNPVTLGVASELETIAGSNQQQQSVYSGISNINTANAHMTTKLSAGMIGRHSVTLAPETVVNALMVNPLRGKSCRIRYGYAGIADTVTVYNGIVRDMSFARGAYTLTIQDDIEIADVSVPRKQPAAWDAAKTYAIGDTAFYNTTSYQAAAASTGITPPNATYWTDLQTPWDIIGYTNATGSGTDWHMADIAIDLIINRINIPTSRVNLSSIAAMRTVFPTRTGSRTLTKPEKAFAMLTEIAWLLEGQWVVLGGVLAFVRDPAVGTQPIEHLGVNDIQEGLQYRRGWADLKNECLILSGYSSGSTNAAYSTGVAVADAQSVSDYDMAALHLFHDKWGLPRADLEQRASNFITRWKDGRRAVVCSCSMRTFRLEPGDVVSIESDQFPVGDSGPFIMVVVGRDIDWVKQTIKLSLLEI